MTVPPNLEGSSDLLVTELSPVAIAVVARFPRARIGSRPKEKVMRSVAQPLLLGL
jgi:hypothetical protein